MNMFSYYITTYFIPSNKDYNSYRNSYLVYQTYPKKMPTNYIYPNCGHSNGNVKRYYFSRKFGQVSSVTYNT